MKLVQRIRDRVGGQLARLRRIDATVGEVHQIEEDVQRRLDGLSGHLYDISVRLDVLTRNNALIMEAVATLVETGREQRSSTDAALAGLADGLNGKADGLAGAFHTGLAAVGGRLDVLQADVAAGRAGLDALADLQQGLERLQAAALERVAAAEARLDARHEAASAESRQVREAVADRVVGIAEKLDAIAAELAAGREGRATEVDDLRGDLSRVLRQTEAAGAGQIALLNQIEALGTEAAALRRSLEGEVAESVASVGQRIDALRTELASSAQIDGVAGELRALSGQIDQVRAAAQGAVVGETARVFAPAAAGGADPELGLLAALKPRLASASAIDVGAHLGEYSFFLLQAGFEVVALEPNPKVFEDLNARLGEAAGFKALNVAAGRAEGRGALWLASDRSDGVYGDPTLFSSLVRHGMPSDLVFEEQATVEVRTLGGLLREGLLPPRPGLLKIDVEGAEGEVLDGAEGLEPEIVITEFWSPDSLFAGQGAQNEPRDLFMRMTRRGYNHLIQFNRFHGTSEVTYVVNYPDALENSWGNMIFFRDARLFEDALRWCAASLRRAYPGIPAERREPAGGR